MAKAKKVTRTGEMAKLFAKQFVFDGGVITVGFVEELPTLNIALYGDICGQANPRVVNDEDDLFASRDFTPVGVASLFAVLAEAKYYLSELYEALENLK